MATARRRGAGTTAVGYVNPNGQEVVRPARRPGHEGARRLYVLRCTRPWCGQVYGATGSEIGRRKCPRCQGGRPGIPLGEGDAPTTALGPLTPATILASIAGQYEGAAADRFSGRDHDRVLYGAKGRDGLR